MGKSSVEDTTIEESFGKQAGRAREDMQRLIDDYQFIHAGWRRAACVLRREPLTSEQPSTREWINEL